jgi:hypothetical protein
VYKTLEQARDFFKEHGLSEPSNNWTPKYQGPGWEDKFKTIPNTSSYRLRFDAECPNVVPFDAQLNSVFDIIQLDLEDLAENGDVNDYSDYLMKNADGAKKRGLKVKDVVIYEASLYKEEKAETTEYTCYLLGRGLFE